jgi:arylformamidase
MLALLENERHEEMEIFDISVLTNPDIPIWPNTPGFRLTRSLDQRNGDEVTSSTITSDVHCGTHIDAPLHFIIGAEDATKINLEKCIGPAFVADLTGVREITPELLEANVPLGVERLLLKTDNSRLWPKSEFYRDFTALTDKAAEWVCERNLKLIGIDYLSIQLFSGEARTHTVLMEAGVVILESIDLSKISEGFYHLICLPLSIENAEAVPARAVLLPLNQQ